jgi:hypothetical protein
MWCAVASARAEDAAPADAPPSAELLMFLAEFGDAQEGFVDPAEVDEALQRTRAATANAPAARAAHERTQHTDDDTGEHTEHDDHAPPQR